LDKRPPKKKGREINPRPKRRDNDPRLDILGLQQTSGNQAVNQLIQGVADSSRETASAQVTGPETISTSGKAIDPDVRSGMESRFGHDFSDVRVHTDGAADKSATELGARAYTKGKNIVFASGKYQPETVEGQQRLAHELTHVIQQQRSGNGRGKDNRLSSPHDASEREADAVSRKVTGGKHAPSIVAAGVGIQRDPAKHPLLDDFEKKFPDAGKAIRKNALALKLVTEAEAASVKFGGFSEDGPGKIAWPYMVPETKTVYVPKARTDATIAMSDFLFELNNAIRGPQLLGLQTEAAKGTKTKLTAKQYAYKILELEVEGMIRTGVRCL
jgi:hypothetical protein